MPRAAAPLAAPFTTSSRKRQRPPDDESLTGVGTDSIRHPLTRTLLVLTLTTGVIDAASYLGLGRVFAANMTGNIVLLGFGIAGSSGLPVVAPLVSLTAFLCGAVVGGRMGTMRSEEHTSELQSPC